MHNEHDENPKLAVARQKRHGSSIARVHATAQEYRPDW
jgi:hypothetical protein